MRLCLFFCRIEYQTGGVVERTPCRSGAEHSKLPSTNGSPRLCVRRRPPSCGALKGRGPRVGLGFTVSLAAAATLVAATGLSRWSVGPGRGIPLPGGGGCLHSGDAPAPPPRSAPGASASGCAAGVSAYPCAGRGGVSSGVLFVAASGGPAVSDQVGNSTTGGAEGRGEALLPPPHKATKASVPGSCVAAPLLRSVRWWGTGTAGGRTSAPTTGSSSPPASPPSRGAPPPASPPSPGPRLPRPSRGCTGVYLPLPMIIHLSSFG